MARFHRHNNQHLYLTSGSDTTTAVRSPGFHEVFHWKFSMDKVQFDPCQSQLYKLRPVASVTGLSVYRLKILIWNSSLFCLFWNPTEHISIKWNYLFQMVLTKLCHSASMLDMVWVSAFRHTLFSHSQCQNIQNLNAFKCH